MTAATGVISTTFLCKAESSASPCRVVSSVGSKCQALSFRLLRSPYQHDPSFAMVVRRVANSNEHSDDFVLSPGFRRRRGTGNGCGKGGRMALRAKLSWASEPPPLTEMEFEDARMEVLERVGQLNSITDFTRFRDKGSEGAELQTAIITYRNRFPWSLFRPQQVMYWLNFHMRLFSVRMRIMYLFLHLFQFTTGTPCLESAENETLRWCFVCCFDAHSQVDLVAAVHIADRE